MQVFYQIVVIFIVAFSAQTWFANSIDLSQCRVPLLDRVANFSWDQSKKSSGGYYFPLSSITDNIIQRRLLGSCQAKCARMRWSDNQVTVNIFYGYVGSLTEAYFKCTQITPPKNIWSCEHLHAKSETSDLSHFAWITMTDNMSYSFTVRCFPSIKKQGWVLFTTEKTISNELRHKVLDHAMSLGFPVLPGIDVLIRNYSTCEPFTLV